MSGIPLVSLRIDRRLTGSADAEERRAVVAPAGLQHVHTPSPAGRIRFISALVRVLTQNRTEYELICLFNTFCTCIAHLAA